MNWRDHIVVDPHVLVGKPVIKGTRISVEHITRLLSDGWREEDILRNYPHLTRVQILACLSYATELLSGERVYPMSA